MGERVDSVADARCRCRCRCTTLRTTQLPTPLAPPPPFPPLFLCPRICPLGVSLGSTWLWGCCRFKQGWGGGGDAGSGPSLREFPHWGADACTAPQGRPFVPAPYKWTCAVTRYVGPSPHRGRVHCGYLGSPCGIDTSLAYPDGRCALPAAPHRTRTAVRAVGSALGQAHWPPPQAGATSGRWLTVPGVTHFFACAQVGPIRTPGGGPKPLRSGTSPASFAGSPAPPQFAALLVPACQLPSPGASVSHLPLLSALALAHWCLLFFFPPLVTRLSPRRFGLSSAPPLVPSLSSRCPRPFRGRLGEYGVGGGGGAPRCLSPGVSTSRARCRHEARHLSLCRFGGG